MAIEVIVGDYGRYIADNYDAPGLSSVLNNDCNKSSKLWVV